MARNLESETSIKGTRASNSSGASTGDDVTTSVSSNSGGSTQTNSGSRTGTSQRQGESRQLANIGCRISFSVPLLGRVPIDSSSPC